MKELLDKIKELSTKYEKISNNFGTIDIDYCRNCKEILNEGKSQAYWTVHIELDKLIKKYN